MPSVLCASLSLFVTTGAIDFVSKCARARRRISAAGARQAAGRGLKSGAILSRWLLSVLVAQNITEQALWISIGRYS